MPDTNRSHKPTLSETLRHKLNHKHHTKNPLPESHFYEVVSHIIASRASNLKGPFWKSQNEAGRKHQGQKNENTEGLPIQTQTRLPLNWNHSKNTKPPGDDKNHLLEPDPN